MMDNEIVTIGENMMIRLIFFLKFVQKIIFVNNVKQFLKYCHGMNVTPLALLSTILCMNFVKN
jgi:hypothetical protein